MQLILLQNVTNLGKLGAFFIQVESFPIRQIVEFVFAGHCFRQPHHLR